VEGTGHELGPNLAAMKNRGPETILLNVLDPNREVNPQFLSYVLVTSEGKTLSGIIAAESATSVTLRRADGQGDEVLRSEIEELRSTGMSLMPEGLEKQIDQGAMADVIAYLMSLK
jgi:putative heme-binding domain-containing protein